MKRMFQTDWASLLQMNLVKLVLAHDDDLDPERDENNDGIPDEVEEVGVVLWDSWEIINALFYFYATSCGCSTGRFEHLTLNAFSEFMITFRLCSKRGQFCKRRDADGCFLATEAADIDPNRNQGTTNQGKGKLGRLQFICALVRWAIRKYVMPKLIEDVSEALQKMLETDLLGLLGGSLGFEFSRTVFIDKDAFRRRHLYNEQMSCALCEHEGSLRSLFEILSATSTDGPQCREAQKLVDLNEWLSFVRAAGLTGYDASERNAALCFVWSRVTVVDRTKRNGAVRDTCLPFEGFLEAICRLSALKALPTLEELVAARYHPQEGCASYLKHLKMNNSEAWTTLLKERSKPWGAEPSQPLPDSVRMVISIIKDAVGTGDDGKISRAEASLWIKKSISGAGRKSSTDA